MINAWWLVLIVPVSMVAGAFCMALAAAGKANETRERLKAYEHTGLAPEEIEALIQDRV